MRSLAVVSRRESSTSYDDAKKGQNDETLEAALFAAANTD